MEDPAPPPPPLTPGESFQAGTPMLSTNRAGWRSQDKAGGTRSQQTIILATLVQGWEGKPGPGLASPRSPT